MDRNYTSGFQAKEPVPTKDGIGYQADELMNELVNLKARVRRLSDAVRGSRPTQVDGPGETIGEVMPLVNRMHKARKLVADVGNELEVLEGAL